MGSGGSGLAVADGGWLEVPASAASSTTAVRYRVRPNAPTPQPRTAFTSTDHTVNWARCRRVELAGDAAGEKRLAACLDAQAHRFRHEDRLARAGDGGVEEH